MLTTSSRRRTRGGRSSVTAARLKRVRARMRELSLDGLLVTVRENVCYLCGFTGSHGLVVVTQTAGCLVTDSRYTLQSAHEVQGLRRLITNRGLLEETAMAHLLAGCATVGFESQAVTYAQHRRLRSLFPGVSLRPTEELVEEIALVKEPGEIAILSRAAAIADAVFGGVLSAIIPGATELDIAAEISWLNRTHGAERDAFDVIVASGPRGAMPHARPTAKKIKTGECVILDFGSTVEGYSSDLTRTVAVGKVPRMLRTGYDAVLEAHGAAIEAARGGMQASELDGIARARIIAAGLGKFFVHSLGHGLGLHIHERPRVSALSKETLRSGSVITIEPGVYIPALGGVRIEDDVILNDAGCRLLTASPRELIVL